MTGQIQCQIQPVMTAHKTTLTFAGYLPHVVLKAFYRYCLRLLQTVQDGHYYHLHFIYGEAEGQREEVTCSREILLWTRIVRLQSRGCILDVAFESQGQSTKPSNWPESNTKTESTLFLLVTGLIEAKLLTFYKVWGYLVPRRAG